jgi:hypothetical protein
MSPRTVQFAWSSQRSVTKILPSTVPRTFTDFVLISPRTRARSPMVSVPVETIEPSTSPSRSSSFRNLTEPLIETPPERRATPGTTDGSGRFVSGGSVRPRGGKSVKVCTTRNVPNYSGFRKRNRKCESRDRGAVAPLLSRTMRDDIGFHDAVAGIVRCDQCVRVGPNVSPEILHLGPLAVDLFLIVIYECVALPMRVQTSAGAREITVDRFLPCW